MDACGRWIEEEAEPSKAKKRTAPHRREIRASSDGGDGQQGTRKKRRSTQPRDLSIDSFHSFFRSPFVPHVSTCTFSSSSFKQTKPTYLSTPLRTNLPCHVISFTQTTRIRIHTFSPRCPYPAASHDNPSTCVVVVGRRWEDELNRQSNVESQHSTRACDACHIQHHHHLSQLTDSDDEPLGKTAKAPATAVTRRTRPSQLARRQPWCVSCVRVACFDLWRVLEVVGTTPKPNKTINQTAHIQGAGIYGLANG